MNNFKHPKKHANKDFLLQFREVVFGMQDGMVSTLGAVIGIAAGSGESSIVILSGFVIIVVESISMGVGSFVSNKAVSDTHRQSIEEEKLEIKHYPEEEQKELEEIYRQDGWPEDMAIKMAEVAALDRKLFLHEMKYHEHGICETKYDISLRMGLSMFFAYIIGGLVPLLSFFFLALELAMPFAVVITFAGLFMLGCLTSKYSGRKWWKAGLELLFLAMLASGAGYLIGCLFDKLMS